MSKDPEQFLSIGAATDVGQVRRLNEDSIGTPKLMRVPARLQQAKGDLLVVADGMGGHAAGEVASQMAVRVVFKAFYSAAESDVSSSLRRAIESANAQIHALAATDMEMGGMGTTLVAAVIRGDELSVANVGDSRAYLVRAGRIRQMSRDHSWVAESVAAGLISEAEAKSHPQRSLITRSLGARPKVEVDLFRARLQPGDCLILCSDGLTNEVSDASILDLVGHNDAAVAATSLVDRANQGQGRDNVSVVVAQVPGGSNRKLVVAPLLALAALAVLAVGILLVIKPWDNWGMMSGRTSPTPGQVVDVTKTPQPTLTRSPVAIASSVPTEMPDAVHSPLEPASPLPTPRPLPPMTPTPPGAEAFQAGPEAPTFPEGPVGIREAWVCEGGTCADRFALRGLGRMLGYEDEAAAEPKLWLEGSSDGLLRVLPQHVEDCLFGAVNPSTVPESEPTFDLVSNFAYTTYTQSPPHNFGTALVLGGYVTGGFRPTAGIACKGERFDECISFLPPEADYDRGPRHMWFQGDDCQRWAPLADLDLGDRSFLVYAVWQGAESYSIPGAIGQAVPAVFVWDEGQQIYTHYADLPAGTH